MKLYQLPTNLSLWISALCLMLTVQSCNKQEDASPAEPSTVTAQASATAVPCKTVGLVAGQHTLVGTVGVATLSNGDVQVTYTITTPGIYLNEIHLDAFTSTAQLQSAKKLSNGGAIPGKFAFKQTWNSTARATTYTQTIPRAYIAALGSPNGCYFIASHAALSNGETAWGGLYRTTSTGVSLDTAKQFPGNNWSVYFEFCTSECTQTVDYTYAWEDLQNTGNDADYNDLVIQSDIIKTASELKATFTAMARGAAYDHKFKFKVPKAGILEVLGASYTEDANFYYVTVFESTKAALASGTNTYANTQQAMPCVATTSKQVTLTLKSDFVYNSAKPLEPFISVYQSGDASVGTAYDLYIYQLSNRDTWTANNNVYPNGIIIPADWRWPTESIDITRPYPNFTSLNSPTGFTAAWAGYLAAPELTFDKNACN